MDWDGRITASPSSYRAGLPPRRARCLPDGDEYGIEHPWHCSHTEPGAWVGMARDGSLQSCYVEFPSLFDSFDTDQPIRQPTFVPGRTRPRYAVRQSRA